jgi:hypothetical protein
MKTRFVFLIFLISGLGIISCQNQSESTRVNDSTEKVYYFDFDEVDHYSIKISGSAIDSLSYNSDSLPEPQKFLSEMVLRNVPESILDTAFIANLESVGFIKHDIPEDKIDALNDIFREKTFDPLDPSSMCMPEYRDILIFRKSGAITGIVKVCFVCSVILIRGTDAETKYFGADRGYQKLSAILYPKS